MRTRPARPGRARRRARPTGSAMPVGTTTAGAGPSRSGSRAPRKKSATIASSARMPPSTDSRMRCVRETRGRRAGRTAGFARTDGAPPGSRPRPGARTGSGSDRAPPCTPGTGSRRRARRSPTPARSRWGRRGPAIERLGRPGLRREDRGRHRLRHPGRGIRLEVDRIHHLGRLGLPERRRVGRVGRDIGQNRRLERHRGCRRLGLDARHPVDRRIERRRLVRDRTVERAGRRDRHRRAGSAGGAGAAGDGGGRGNGGGRRARPAGRDGGGRRDGRGRRERWRADGPAGRGRGAPAADGAGVLPPGVSPQENPPAGSAAAGVGGERGRSVAPVARAAPAGQAARAAPAGWAARAAAGWRAGARAAAERAGRPVAAAGRELRRRRHGGRRRERLRRRRRGYAERGRAAGATRRNRAAWPWAAAAPAVRPEAAVRPAAGAPAAAAAAAEAVGGACGCRGACGGSGLPRRLRLLRRGGGWGGGRARLAPAARGRPRRGRRGIRLLLRQLAGRVELGGEPVARVLVLGFAIAHCGSSPRSDRSIAARYG